jgi:hypothetical protein
LLGKYKGGCYLGEVMVPWICPRNTSQRWQQDVKAEVLQMPRAAPESDSFTTCLQAGAMR